MAFNPNPPPFVLAIDTNGYAGNFERELCAYVTGCYGDCEVGREVAEEAIKEIRQTEFWIDDEPKKLPPIVLSVPDDYGCFRPVGIGPTPGFWNDGHGGDYPDSEWENRNGKILDDMKQRIRDDAEGYKDGPNHWIYEERMKKADEATIESKYPAYQSVEIYFNERPSDDLLEFMIERAKRFDWKKVLMWSKFKIIGFRLLSRRIQEDLLVSITP